MLQPFLVEAADADIDPRQRADDADRIGAVMQHMRHLHPGLGARQVEIAPGKHLLLADLQPRAELIDRIHAARIVDVVGCQRRGVDRAWRHRVHHLEQEAVLTVPQHEDACRPQILGSDVARQVFPAWMLRIGRGMQRMRPDMAEAAGHADPVRPDQRRVAVIVGIAVETLRVPALARGSVEVRIGEQPQADDARGAAVGAHERLARKRLAIGGGERRIAAAVRGIEPKPEFVGLVRLFEAGFVHDAVSGKSLRTLAAVEDLEQIEAAEAAACQIVPERLVAGRPHQPGVAAAHLRRRQAASRRPWRRNSRRRPPENRRRPAAGASRGWLPSRAAPPEPPDRRSSPIFCLVLAFGLQSLASANFSGMRLIFLPHKS